MKKLTINWSELTYALDNSSYDFDYYLDTATSEVFFITEEARSDLETLYEEAAAAGDTEEFDLTAALAQSGFTGLAAARRHRSASDCGGSRPQISVRTKIIFLRSFPDHARLHLYRRE